MPVGKNHYLICKPNTGRSFLEFIPENNESEILLPSELEVGKVYEIVITSPLTGLIRYKLGDLVKMNGWFENLPVISVIGRKEISLRSNIYLIKEEEFVKCFYELQLNLPFTFFMDRSRNPASIGVFIENTIDLPTSEEEKSNLSMRIHQYLLENNSAYAVASAKAVNKPISVYFVKRGTFMDWNSYKAERIGIKSTNQIKLTRISLSDEQIDFFKQRVE